ncbi:hypothetical protein NZ35_19965 [Pseudomonas chlororaphis]|uniref:Uncharacterized protein n=1 Tax=Pseudomonas chlororaphis TaxID=587753 RepID=A0A0A6DA70_9PSED|nr:hypothetical protein NZ35_19965 [Pseudomonas chlororaphis]
MGGADRPLRRGGDCSPLRCQIKVKSLPPHPSPLPQGGEGEREQIFMIFKIRVWLDISSW